MFDAVIVPNLTMTLVVSEESLARDRHTDTYTDFIYLLLAYSIHIAQSTTQGHTQVEYNTKHAHYINIKHTNIIQKVVPSVLLS